MIATTAAVLALFLGHGSGPVTSVAAPGSGPSASRQLAPALAAAARELGVLVSQLKHGPSPATSTAVPSPHALGTVVIARTTAAV